ncbi:MAG: branched-chain amino acid ABC transporter permease [Rhodanobacteraceae bacterium]
MNELITQALGILGSAAIIGLISIGLAVSFRLMGIINFAHGTFIMVGAYAGVMSQAAWHLPWVPSVLFAVAVGLALGVASEVPLVRKLYHSPELSILGTFGLAVVLEQVVRLIFGNQFQLSNGPLTGPVDIFGVQYSSYRLLLIVIAVLVLAAVIGVLQFTPMGVRVRAIAADHSLAETLGVRASRLNLGVFTASAGLAALAGVLVAPISTVSPTMGNSYLFTAFITVIVGGSRIWGVLAASILVAAVQNLTATWLNPIVADLAVLALAFLALQWFHSTAVREVV